MDGLDDLVRRIARLEAESGVRRTFHKYLHGVDMGSADAVMSLFTPDAIVDAMNYPPGSGDDRHLVGHEAIRTLYEPVRAKASRHHAANISIAVSDDAQTADVSSYFLTAVEWGMKGGLYEGTMVLDAGEWWITYWRISSQWEWRLTDQGPVPLGLTLDAGALRGGWPA